MNHENISNVTDQYLVEKVLRGDRDAFGVVIRNTESLVAQIVFKMISNTEDRKDLAQDIYLKAFRNLAGFKFQSKLSTWIAQIAYNTCLNFLEKKKLPFIDATDEENYFHTETEKSISQKELSRILESGIERLSPVFKTLITLFHKEELSYAEISAITQLPEGTVKSYLSRARKSLKEDLLINYKKDEL